MFGGGFFMERKKIKELLISWGRISETKQQFNNLDADAKEIMRERYEIYFKKLECFNNIIYSCLTVQEVYFLRLRYVLGVCWDNMPYKLHFSRMHCFRIHNAILDKLSCFLPADFDFENLAGR